MDEGLTLDAVSARFADSERLLTAVREKLERIIDAEERTQASSSTLEAVAEDIRGFVATARDALESLEASQRQVRDVLDAGAKLLDGSALAELQTSVAELREQIPSRMDRLEERIGDRQEADARASAAIADAAGARDAQRAADERSEQAMLRAAELERLVQHFESTQRRAFEKAKRTLEAGA